MRLNISDHIGNKASYFKFIYFHDKKCTFYVNNIELFQIIIYISILLLNLE
jgi:hypothetical protein